MVSKDGNGPHNLLCFLLEVSFRRCPRSSNDGGVG